MPGKSLGGPRWSIFSLCAERRTGRLSCRGRASVLWSASVRAGDAFMVREYLRLWIFFKRVQLQHLMGAHSVAHGGSPYVACVGSHTKGAALILCYVMDAQELDCTGLEWAAVVQVL
jgi:hypothetical protein